MMKQASCVNRRRFLTQCAAFSASGMAGSMAALSSLALPSAALAANRTRPSEYRALVCLYLTGGNDMNMMVPLDDYDNYKRVRGGVAIDRDQLLPITSGTGADTQQFGLHPSMEGAHELYNAKKLAFIANAGALLRPTTAQNFNRAGQSPRQLFSHNSQKDFVRAGLPFDGRRVNGWAGRIADLYADTATVPLNLTLGGNNLWQRGALTSSYALTSNFVATAGEYRLSGSANDRARGDLLQRINKLGTNHLLTREYGRLSQRALDLSEQLVDRVGQGEVSLQTQFPGGSPLREVAELINARKSLNMPQQIFYVDIGGWDQHNDLLSRHQQSLRGLSDQLKAFDSALEEMGLQNNVVTFTNHDFGRTLQPNGSGSDHAWGGHQLVMGGTGGSSSIVKGGAVYGKHPIFSPDDEQYIDFRGVLVPSTSTDQISSSVAKWFGDFSDNELVELFPNLANFNEKTLGFMA